MDIRTNLKNKLPSRHVTEGPERAPHRSHDALGLDVAEVFKRTPYVEDLKRGGRYVAKDMFEAGCVPLLMKTLLDHGFLHGACMTVTGRGPAVNGAATHPGGAAEKQRYADA